jgi:hypothetical protein
VAIDRESRAADLDFFASGGKILPPPSPPVNKPLDVDIARAAANNLILNVVNLNYEIREIVAAHGIQFHNADTENQITLRAQSDPSALQERDQETVPKSLQNDFPESTKDFEAITIIDDAHAVFISHAQRVEYRLRVVETKAAFKKALETPGIHVVYSGHSRFGRGPCFGPDLTMSLDPTTGDLIRDLSGENWETGEDPNKFGLFRMGVPFVGVPFGEMDEHKYKMRPVPTSVPVKAADIDKLTDHNSLKPVILRGTRFESFITDPVEDAYWGCNTDHGNGVLMFADFQNSSSQPLDLGATDLQCRCLTVMSCDSFAHFHEVLRKRKGFARTDVDGFAYFVDSLYFKPMDRLYFASIFEYNVRNDNKSWFPCLEFALNRTNKKLLKMGPQFKVQLRMI